MSQNKANQGTAAKRAQPKSPMSPRSSSKPRRPFAYASAFREEDLAIVESFADPEGLDGVQEIDRDILLIRLHILHILQCDHMDDIDVRAFCRWVDTLCDFVVLRHTIQNQNPPEPYEELKAVLQKAAAEIGVTLP